MFSLTINPEVTWAHNCMKLKRGWYEMQRSFSCKSVCIAHMQDMHRLRDTTIVRKRQVPKESQNISWNGVGAMLWRCCETHWNVPTLWHCHKVGIMLPQSCPKVILQCCHKVVDWHRRYFHFLCAGNVDTYNARRCEKFVTTTCLLCWGISSNFSGYVKLPNTFFAPKISKNILQISMNFLKNQGPREKTEFKEVKSKLLWQQIWCIILDRS